MKTKKKTPRARLVKKLDKAFSLYIRARDDYTCWWCGSDNNQMHCSHIYPRRHLRTRWDEDNAITLCAYCHKQWHSDPLAGSEWLKLKDPERWGRIMHIKALPSVKMTIADLEDKLKEYDGV